MVSTERRFFIMGNKKFYVSKKSKEKNFFIQTYKIMSGKNVLGKIFFIYVKILTKKFLFALYDWLRH